jgi:hypothetical protein
LIRESFGIGFYTAFLAIGSSKWGQGYARFNVENPCASKAIGLVTLNRNETVTIEVFYGADAELDPTSLIGSQTVALDERGYHLVDLDTPIEIAAHSDFITSLTFFAYKDQSEPLPGQLRRLESLIRRDIPARILRARFSPAVDASYESCAERSTFCPGTHLRLNSQALSPSGEGCSIEVSRTR